jgi:YidC/Oxa1 family membrane protein insertase
MMQQETDYKRIMLAVFLAALVLTGWQTLVEGPRRQQLLQAQAVNAAKVAETQVAEAKNNPVNKEVESEPAIKLSREERIAQSPRVKIASDKLHGSIALRGARFDDLMLAKYRVDLDAKSPEVTLFSPSGDAHAYFVQAGWLATDQTKVPDQNSLWQADRKTLAPGEPVTLTWTNGEGVTFILKIALDRDYMFDIAQRVENHSGRTISVAPYAYINRAYDEPKQQYAISHEGPLGVMENTLEEIPYHDLREKGNQTFEHASGWLGITDKYWLSALAPAESDYKGTFSYYTKGDQHRYQVDYLGKPAPVASGESNQAGLRLFAGAKEIQVLDRYAEGDSTHAPIPLFDRAVDFGSLYFLTKPMFLLLTFFYAHMGNFGIAIMLLTIVVKLAMYPLANKSFHSMAQMRELQPQMMKIRERYADDQIAMNKEMMALYKREKVNPASGCLPVLIQMPVFFALYKVLFVTIEMRHAPFFGWIKDLSAVDPSNIFTLFGLIDWNHPAWMHLGILPMLFTATMVIQMKQQPKPADPVQAKMIAFMPYFFLFLFASFPAGLVVYWVWSNILSILQQQLITRRHRAHLARKKAKAAA